MTYDPVKIISKPKVGTFSGLPSAAPGTILVVDRAGQPVRVLGDPGDRLTAGEARWGHIRTLYEVDVTEHALDFQDAIPYAGDVGGFRATVRLRCAVADPAAVVTRGIRDVARALVPAVTETLRRILGDFVAEDYQLAETAGLTAIRDLERSGGHDAAFQITRAHLVLTLDDTAAAYVHGRKEARRDRTRQADAALIEREKAKLDAELARARAQMEAERERAAAEFERERLIMEQGRQLLEGKLQDQQQELDLARAAARARAEQKGASEIELERLEFEVTRQRKQAELDAQKLELDLDRAQLQAQYDRLQLEAKLERDKIQVTQLTGLLGQGQFAAFAMQLASDPAAIGSVNAYLADQRDADINRQLQALRLLVENDGLEGWQITEQAKSMLHQLISTWSAHATPLPAAGDAPQQLEPGEPAGAPIPRGARHAFPDVSISPPRQPADDDGEYPGDREAPASSAEAEN
jgi:hypothetical protein